MNDTRSLRHAPDESTDEGRKGTMVYFSLDLEASGQVPPWYNLLSIGVTVVRQEGDHHVLGDSFYAELQPIFPGFDPAAVAVTGLDVDRLRKEGEEPKAALERFIEWVRKQNRPSKDWPVFVGHNAVFDWSYMAYYFAHFDLKNPFGYKGIDTKSLAMGRLNVGWKDTSKEGLERLLSLPPQDPAQIHRADYDAWYQALIFKTLLDLPEGFRPA
jgi:DNA polymerase III epsilon subunit-like protein